MAKRQKKKRKYKSITLKLTENQYKSLLKYCNSLSITPVKFIKRTLSRHLKYYVKDDHVVSYVTPNQLNIFEQEL